MFVLIVHGGFFYCVLNSGEFVKRGSTVCTIASYSVFTPNVYSS